MEKREPIIPKAPVPSQVRTSILPEQVPTPKIKDGEEVLVDDSSVNTTEDSSINDDEEEDVDEREDDSEPRGTITIRIFRYHPYEIDFTGKISGSEIDLAWRAMMKQYRVWKHNSYRKQEEDKKGGRNVETKK